MEGSGWGGVFKYNDNLVYSTQMYNYMPGMAYKNVKIAVGHGSKDNP